MRWIYHATTKGEPVKNEASSVGNGMSGEYTTECTNENDEEKVTFATDEQEKANEKGIRGQQRKYKGNKFSGENNGRSLWKTYKGATEGFGAVLGIKSENGPGDTMANFQHHGELWMRTGGISEGCDDVVCIMRDMKRPDILDSKPSELDPAVKMGSVDQILHASKVKRYGKREDMIDENVPALCNVVWGQFSPALRETLKGLDEFEDRYIRYDVVWILEQAKLVASGVDINTSNAYATVHRMMKSLYHYKQGPNEASDKYAKDLDQLIKTVSLAGGNPLYHQQLHDLELRKLTDKRGVKIGEATAAEKAVARKTSEENYRAMLLLEQADPTRFYSLWGKLRTDATLGMDNYPTAWARAYDVLSKYEQQGGKPKGSRRPFGQLWPKSGRSFLQAATGGTLTPGTNGNTYADKTCYNCGKRGHIKPLCPTLGSNRGQIHTTIGLSLAQAAYDKGRHDIVNPDWILLDSCSTITCLKNRDLVVNTRECDDSEQLLSHSNGGGLEYDEIGTTLFLPMPAYVSDDNIANVYSLSHVADRYRVTMDTHAERAMLVHLGNGDVMRFRECGDGLYFFNTRTDNVTKAALDQYSFLTTVAANKSHFHRADIEGADKARILQQDLGWPSTQHFIDIVNNNLLNNCTVTADDIRRAEAIYGPASPILKGKMIRKRQDYIKLFKRVPIPNQIVEEYKLVDLCMDFFFVNGKPYFHTISKKLNFRTSEPSKGRGKLEILRLAKAVEHIYKQRGFEINLYHADNEFSKVETLLLPAMVLLCAAGQHIPEVERSIRTVKERVRAICAGMPYRRIPKLLMDNVVAKGTECLNDFPTKNGVSRTLSPNNIVLGVPKPDCNSMKLRIGQYAEVYQGTTNTPRERSVGAIALRQDKRRGGYYFMSLETKREIHPYVYKALPTPDEVIRQVEDMAGDEGIPFTRNGPIFEWGPGIPIADEGEDINVLAAAAADLEQYEAIDEPAESEERGRPRRAGAGTGVSRLQPSFTGKTYDSNEGIQMLSVSNRKMKTWQKECYDIAVNTTFKCFTQMHASKGFKTYGERAVAAMFKEYKQLIDMKVFGRVDPDKLTVEQKRKALRAIDLIKEKRTGLIKGRTVADGSMQRGYVPKEESASPTSTLDGFLMSLMIDAHENRCVSIFDVPSAFIQTDMPADKEVIIRMVGKFVDIMCEVNPEFKEDVRYKNGQKVLYLKCLKAIYGLIEAALLWYKLYSTTLVKMGFKLNAYDKCIANKVINGKQCTIVWYVDDNKVSHMEAAVVKSIVDAIEKKFHGKLTRSEGNKHTFIGMDIDLKGNGKVGISTPQHLREMIEDFPEEIKGSVVNPAKSKLFNVSADSPNLSEERTGIFRSIVMKGLWASQRSRPDLSTAISFMTTRQSSPTEEDWGKLKRMLCFIKGTIHDERIIGADGLVTMGTYIDAAHAIHNDMRGQTGGAISFGWGVLHGGSSKQKLNTKSSTETELVGVSDYIPRKIWLINFLREQGYELKRKVLYQDNESTMKMLKNGRDSTTSRSRHISIRYFFTADRIQKKEFTVEYCHTHSMLADFYSKALQGKLFHKYRNVLMGWKHISSLTDNGVDSPAKERVGNGMSGEYTTECTNENDEEKVTFATDEQEKANEKGMKMSTMKSSLKYLYP